MGNSKSNPPKVDLLPGFTLVELLVVIAIISVLASILVPSLRNARESANSVLCLSNLRQIGMATNLYVADNESYLPSGWYDGILWGGRLREYFGLSGVSVGGDDPKTFFCPTVGTRGLAGNWTTYGINLYFGWSGSKSPRRITGSDHPSQIIAYLDTNPDYIEVPIPTWSTLWHTGDGTPCMSLVHSNEKYSNVVFLDWHAERINMDPEGDLSWWYIRE